MSDYQFDYGVYDDDIDYDIKCCYKNFTKFVMMSKFGYCPFCNSCIRKTLLKNHLAHCCLQDHTVESFKKYTCKICKYVFLKEENLKIHLNNTHNTDLNEKAQKVEKKFVYFLKNLDKEYEYKIGMTKNIVKRINEIGTSSNKNVQLIWSYECFDSRVFEQYMLKKFKAYRQKGEWLQLDEFMVQNVMVTLEQVKHDYDIPNNKDKDIGNEDDIITEDDIIDDKYLDDKFIDLYYNNINDDDTDNDDTNIDLDDKDIELTGSVHVRRFSYENIDYLDKDLMESFIHMPLAYLSDMIKHIHFNKQHPENHNIKKKAMYKYDIYMKDGFVSVNSTQLIMELIKNVITYAKKYMNMDMDAFNDHNQLWELLDIVLINYTSETKLPKTDITKQIHKSLKDYFSNHKIHNKITYIFEE